MSERSDLQFIDSIIRDSKSILGAAILITEFSNVLIKTSVISGSYAGIAIFEIGNSNLTVSNSEFSKNFNILFLADESELIINNTFISYHTCEVNMQGCITFSSRGTKVNIVNLKIMNLSSLNQDNIYLQSAITTIEGLIMKNVSASKQKGSCLGAMDSAIYINQSFFENFFWNCLNIEKSNLSIENITLCNSLPDSPKLYGAFLCDDCESYEIRSSLFQKNKNIIKGAALFLKSTIKAQTTFLVENLLKDCLFIENHAFEDGGGLNSENQHLIIKNSTFALNKAERGGGIFNKIQGKTKFMF